jgi:ABC-type transporter Mla MlaB component
VLRPRTGPTVILTRGDAEVATWPLAHGSRPDMEIVDQLARLQLQARRLGCSIRVRRACAELRELIELSGLEDVLVSED